MPYIERTLERKFLRISWISLSRVFWRGRNRPKNCFIASNLIRAARITGPCGSCRLLYHAFFSVKCDAVFQDIRISFLPQRFLVFLLFNLPERLVTLAFQFLIGMRHLDLKDDSLSPDTRVLQQDVRASISRFPV